MRRADLVEELDVEGAVAEEQGARLGADLTARPQQGEAVGVFGQFARKGAEGAHADSWGEEGSVDLEAEFGGEVEEAEAFVAGLRRFWLRGRHHRHHHYRGCGSGDCVGGMMGMLEGCVL